MTHPDEVGRSIRRSALVLGALPIVALAALALTGRFSLGGTEEALPLNEAWERGLLQGYLLIILGLVPIAIGVWRRREWARWAALMWFPILFAGHALTTLRLRHTVGVEALLEGIPIGAVWLWVVHRQLFTREVSSVFRHQSAA